MNLLIVEDDRNQSEVLRRTVLSYFPEINIKVAYEGKKALKMAETTKYDISYVT